MVNGSARIEVRTFKEQSRLLSRLAHDVSLRLHTFRLEVARGRVSLEFEPGSLVVEGALVAGRLDPSVLSTAQRSEIEDNVYQRVLEIGSFPLGRYEGKYAVEGHQAMVSGSLTLHGITQPVDFGMRRAAEGWQGEVTLVPSRFGIPPFSAMLGALKLRDKVAVLVQIPPDAAGVDPTA